MSKNFLCFFLLLTGFQIGFSQNSGIGTATPTHTFHIKPDMSNPTLDPLRLENLQAYVPSQDTSFLVVDPDSGVVKTMSMTELLNLCAASLESNMQLNGNWLSMDGDDEGLSISSTGQIGIGTDVPEADLHIQATSATAVVVEASSPKVEWKGQTSGETGYIQLVESNTLSPSAGSYSGVLEVVGNDGLNFKGKDKTNPDISVLSTGDIELLAYGGGTKTGTEAYLLGVEADGSLVEVPTTAATGVYGSDGALGSSRRISLRGNSLTLGGTNDVTFTGEGEMGIGVTTPQAPLHVVGANTLNPEDYISGGDGDNRYGALMDENIGKGYGTSGDTYAIIAEQKIAASEFHAYSDRRIKERIQSSYTGEDLALLRQLRVTNYKYKDQIRNDQFEKKGFIAQEVREIFPQAVTMRTAFLPDIFLPATSWKHQGGMLSISLDEAHGLEEGDFVKLLTSEGDKILSVASITSPIAFEVESKLFSTKSLFVYGKQVNDFHTLDYDEIFTLNVAATQALADQVDQLTQALKQVQEEVKHLRASLEAGTN